MIFRNLPPTIHWHNRMSVETNLFRPETRPAAVQTVYARAHAPGDVRLSSQNSYPSFTGMVRKRIQAANRSRFNKPQAKKNATDFTSNEFESSEVSSSAIEVGTQCQCYCGTCHPLSDHALLNHRLQPLANEQLQCDCSNQVNSSSSSSPRQSSSASSVVTWSSVTSSVFEPSQMNSQHTHGHHHHHHHQHRHSQQPNRRSHPLTSTSSGDYYLIDKPNGQSAIDAFFRKNPMVLESYDNIGNNYRKPSSVCTCSCTANSQSSPPRTDRQIVSDGAEEHSSSTTKNVKSVISYQQTETKADIKSHRTSNATINTETSHWQWWFSSTGSSMAMNTENDGKLNGGDENDINKRWSTAVAMASSPLKPAKFDTETTDWLKENIETRRVKILTINIKKT